MICTSVRGESGTAFPSSISRTWRLTPRFWLVDVFDVKRLPRHGLVGLGIGRWRDNSHGICSRCERQPYWISDLVIEKERKLFEA
jgi:hypothetical protein